MERQKVDKCGNNVLSFVQEILSPTRFASNLEGYEYHREEINKILLHCGFKIREDGKLLKVNHASSISEAQLRANELSKKLRDRKVHSNVIKFCKAELLEQNYFHCVLEASKSIADRLRDMTGEEGDGAGLVEKVLSTSAPKIALNSLRTDSEKSDQKGFSNLLKGIFGTFRNTRAHEPRLYWANNEDDVLDALTMMSYVHRRLDSAVSVPRF